MALREIQHQPLTDYKVKNRKLAEKRLQQISEAALTLFSQKGYHNTTIKDIARLSNLSTGSIYDYVNSKEDILFLVSRNFFDHLNKNVENALRGLKDPFLKLKATVEAALMTIDRFQDYVLITYRESKYFKKQDLLGIFRQEAFFIEIFMKILEEGNRKGVFDVKEPFLVANLITLMTHCWALKRYSLKGFSLFSFKETLIEVVLEGITKRRQPNRKRSGRR